MAKVSIVGVGKLGANLAYTLISNPKIDEIVLVDINKQKTEGIAFDISHAYPEFSHKLKVGGHEDTKDSKIIIITAGMPRDSQSMARVQLLDTNKKIITEIVQSLKCSKTSILIIVSNPVEPLTYLAYKISKLEWNRVIGFSNILDSERLKFILSQKTGIPPEKICSLVMGEHGENMIPVFSQCEIDSKHLTNFNLDTCEITAELKGTAKKIIDLTGATQYGPVRHLENLIDSVLNNSNQIFSIAFFVEKNDFYGVSNVCMSLPAKVNANGIAHVENVELNGDEKNKLKSLSETLKKIQKEMI